MVALLLWFSMEMAARVSVDIQIFMQKIFIMQAKEIRFDLSAMLFISNICNVSFVSIEYSYRSKYCIMIK